MDNEIRKLIEKNLIRDIQIKLYQEKKEGQIINETIIHEILNELVNNEE